MNDSAPIRELDVSAKRLLRYRIPLILAILLNCYLVARIPFGKFNASNRSDAQTSGNQVAQVTTEPKKTAVAEDSEPTNTAEPTAEAADPHKDDSTKNADAHTVFDAEVVSDTDGAVSPVTLAFQLASNETFRQTMRNWGYRTKQLFQPSPRNVDWPELTATEESEESVKPSHDLSDDWDLPDFEPVTVTLPDIQTDQTPIPHVNQLVLHNPLENDGVVQFLVDRIVHVLHPGETLELASPQEWHILFHRGDMFGNEEHWLAGGSYVFSVSEDGWSLSPAARD